MISLAASKPAESGVASLEREPDTFIWEIECEIAQRIAKVLSRLTEVPLFNRSVPCQFDFVARTARD